MYSPITGKPMELRMRHMKLSWQGLELSVPCEYWLCVDSGHKFTTTEQDEVALELLRKAYDSYTNTTGTTVPGDE